MQSRGLGAQREEMTGMQRVLTFCLPPKQRMGMVRTSSYPNISPVLFVRFHGAVSHFFHLVPSK